MMAMVVFDTVNYGAIIVDTHDVMRPIIKAAAIKRIKAQPFFLPRRSMYNRMKAALDLYGELRTDVFANQTAKHAANCKNAQKPFRSITKA